MGNVIQATLPFVGAGEYSTRSIYPSYSQTSFAFQRWIAEQEPFDALWLLSLKQRIAGERVGEEEQQIALTS